jgi:signal transduction histidine kinase
MIKQRISSRITTKIGLLVSIQAIFIIGSVIILSHFESQGTLLGNSVNVAGKNRFLTSSVLLRTEEYLSGVSNASAVNAAMDNLQSNLLILKEGGRASVPVELAPLPSKYLNVWDTINNHWQAYKGFITNNIIKPPSFASLLSSLPTGSLSNGSTAVTKKESQFMAFEIINLSNSLTVDLGNDVKNNSQNLILLEMLLGALNIAIIIVIFYLVRKILTPIFALTKAASEIKKGNLNVLVDHKGNDELAILAETFNSMASSIKKNIEKQQELTVELQNANKELNKKDKLKDEFVGIVSHELRTPVQSILGFASLANDGQIETKEAYRGVLLEAHRLQQLTNDLLDVSRIESGISLTYAMKAVRINEIILDVVNGAKVSLKEGVSIETKIGGNDDRSIEGYNNNNNNDIEIYADKSRITQAISNIVVNAVKFTDSGTIIVESIVSNDKQRVEVKVSDSGSGIAEDILPNLFDKFVTKTLGNENKRGTGLGLYIAKAIIDAHKGKIFAYNNEQGVGATFTIVIPSISAAGNRRVA